MKRSDNQEDRFWQAGRRVSLRELFWWVTAISVALAIPLRLGLPLLPVIFYGTLGGLMWRLSRAMPLHLAALIAVTAALALAATCTLCWPEII